MGPQVSVGNGTLDKIRLDPDGHARMGVCLFLAVGNFSDPRAANAAAWAFFTRTTLNPTISVGTTEAELTCCSWCSRELISAYNFATEVLPWVQIRTPVAFGDNTAANLIAAGAASVRAVRHLCLQRLYCRWVCKEGLINVKEKRTHSLTADLLTKVVPGPVLERLLRLLNIVD